MKVLTEQKQIFCDLVILKTFLTFANHSLTCAINLWEPCLSNVYVVTTTCLDTVKNMIISKFSGF